jgi:hypothetical protein
MALLRLTGRFRVKFLQNRNLVLFGAFFASQCVLAQNGRMVALPEYGVALTGSPKRPIITNNSTKTVIGYVLRFSDRDGRGPYLTALLIYPRSAELLPGASKVATDAAQRSIQTASGHALALRGGPQLAFNYLSTLIPPVCVIVDAVVFSDGEFAGPDDGKHFDAIALDLGVFRTIGQQLTTPVDKFQAWQQLSIFAGPPIDLNKPVAEETPEHLKQRIVAYLLLSKKDSREESALELATYFSSIPALWRKK